MLWETEASRTSLLGMLWETQASRMPLLGMLWETQASRTPLLPMLWETQATRTPLLPMLWDAQEGPRHPNSANRTSHHTVQIPNCHADLIPIPAFAGRPSPHACGLASKGEGQ